MKHKKILRPDRLRQPPAQFSWVDHRLVREGHLRRCHADGLALYLFLVTVADADGLSYYGDTTAAKTLSMDLDRLRAARNNLVAAGLIAYEHPFYQVLSLDAVPPSAALPPPPPPAASRQRGGLRSVGDILSNMGGRP
jgi:hypothetical protein